MRFQLITDLSSDNLKGLVLSLAIPSMLSQLISVFYSIVDRMYIGNIPIIGDVALAGVGVVGPIVTMITSFAFLVGIGGSPLLSKSLGEGKRERAFDIIRNCFYLILMIAAFVTAGAYIIKDPMLRTFGASEQLFPYANEYFSIYLIGIVFSLIATGLNQLVICQGFGKQGMFSVVLGAVLNIVLDPIFIFVFGLGIKGAAIATVISQFASCVFVLRFLFSPYALIKITFGKPNFRLMAEIIKIGLTSFLIVIFDNFMLIALNTVLQRYGGPGYGDMLLTCNTILQSFMLIITMPLGGLTTGTQTILGYNYGARKPEKIIEAQRVIMKMGVLFCSIMFIVAWLCSKPFVLIFTRTPEYVDLTVRIIRLSTIGIIPLAIQYGIVDGYTALGQVNISLPLSALRKIVYFICVFLLPLWLPIEYVFIAESISDILPEIVTITTYHFTKKKLLKMNDSLV